MEEVTIPPADILAADQVEGIESAGEVELDQVTTIAVAIVVTGTIGVIVVEEEIYRPLRS